MIDSLEVGFIFQNTKVANEEGTEAMKKMDEAIEKSMLEFLKDDLESVQKENRNTGGLLAQDEKVGIERFIESLQMVSWSNMEMAQRKVKPALSCVIGENQAPMIEKNQMQKL